MMENLQSLESLDSLFAKIANILGLAVDQVQVNGMDYVLEYGKYCLGKELVSAITGSALIGLVILVVIWVGFGAFLSDETDEKEPFKKSRNVGFTISLPIILLIISLKLIPYFMSPTMYSIERCLELLN